MLTVWPKLYVDGDVLRHAKFNFVDMTVVRIATSICATELVNAKLFVKGVHWIAHLPTSLPAQ